MSLSYLFLEGIVGRVKDCKCELDKCKDIKKMAISTRKSFEKDIENAKTIFLMKHDRKYCIRQKTNLIYQKSGQ